MKGFESVKYVYLLGIGGIGMSGLARYFNRQGKSVSGYDRTETTLTKELSNEGILIHYDDNVDLVPKEVLNGSADETLFIYTPAIPKDHKELNYLKGIGVKLKKRSEVLGMITEGTFTIAVGGTHGKTTTSTLVAHILKTAGFDMTAFLGGISANYNTNFLLGDRSEFVVVEADEFDRSFLTLHPDIAIITSTDADHLDIYGSSDSVKSSYSEFAGKVKRNGKLIVNHKIAADFKPGKLTYAIDEPSDFRSVDLNLNPFSTEFSFHSSNQNSRYELGIPGIHNVENATAAIAVAELLKIDNTIIDKALRTFSGVRRRFEYHLKDKTIFIDDYAHHPAELKAFIESVKKVFPEKKITGIFQPHLYTRTRDFADGFIEALSLLNEVVLLEIYPARELPIEGVNSAMLLDRIHSENKRILTKSELQNYIRENDFEVLLTMGAGDIDLLVEPIKNILKEK